MKSKWINRSARKMNGFTLVELIVVLILSGIVVSTFGLVYFFTVQQFQVFISKNQDVHDYLTLDNSLKHDFWEAREIRKLNATAIVLSFDTLKEVKYTFKETMIIRKQAARIDTFQIGIDHLWLSFKGKEQEDHGELIDDLQIVTNYPVKDVTLFHRKQYDACAAMNENVNDWLERETELDRLLK